MLMAMTDGGSKHKGVQDEDADPCTRRVMYIWCAFLMWATRCATTIEHLLLVLLGRAASNLSALISLEVLAPRSPDGYNLASCS
jgi:hypothetical protein